VLVYVISKGLLKKILNIKILKHNNPNFDKRKLIIQPQEIVPNALNLFYFIENVYCQ